MARPREFDLDEALEAALGVFWQQGYAATSMADLMAAMGLEKGSIYKAWSGKRELFLATLQRYHERGLDHLRRRLAAARSPGEGLRRWLLEHGGRSRGCTRQQGCFVINSIVELAPHDDEVAGIAAAHDRAVRALLTATVRAAQHGGELWPEPDAGAFARTLLVASTGLAVRGKVRAGGGGRDARAVVELLLRAPPPPGP